MARRTAGEPIPRSSLCRRPISLPRFCTCSAFRTTARCSTARGAPSASVRASRYRGFGSRSCSGPAALPALGHLQLATGFGNAPQRGSDQLACFHRARDQAAELARGRVGGKAGHDRELDVQLVVEAGQAEPLIEPPAYPIQIERGAGEQLEADEDAVVFLLRGLPFAQLAEVLKGVLEGICRERAVAGPGADLKDVGGPAEDFLDAADDCRSDRALSPSERGRRSRSG